MSYRISPCLRALAIAAAVAGIYGCSTVDANLPVTSVTPSAKQVAAETPTVSEAPKSSPMLTVDPEFSVFFGSSSADIDAQGRAVLARHAERLKANPKETVTLIAHTDDLGSRSYNLAIAEKRVSAVRSHLRRLGVPVRQLRQYRIGAEKHEVRCQTSECRRLLRRVDIQYPAAR
jgi:outer membrane protein OmpA-like peptidoglycan-associated protein